MHIPSCKVHDIIFNNLKEKKNIEYLMYIGKDRKKLDTDLDKEKEKNNRKNKEYTVI